MKTKKIGIIILITIAIVAFLLGHIISYANDETIYVNLTATDLNGIGYGIGNPKNAGEGNYLWYLRTYNSNNVNDLSATQRNLYCIKANYGNTWNSTPNRIIGYNLSYDLQKDREKLLRLLVPNTANNVVSKLLDAENGYYRELLWILDNAYIEGQTNKDAFLDKIGIGKDSEGYYNKDTQDIYNYIMTDADIKAVQRAAIWYFTNYRTDGEQAFNKKDLQDWLTITTDGTTYINLKDATKFQTTEGEERNNQAVQLYNYLINGATANANKYTAANNYNIDVKPANVKTTDLAQAQNGKYIIQTRRIGSNYVVGPIVINKNNDSLYDISLKVSDQKGNEIKSPNYTITDSNGSSLGNITLKDLVGRTEGFYITIARNLHLKK